MSVLQLKFVFELNIKHTKKKNPNMAPKVPFEDPVSASNYNVIRGDKKKAKSAITSQLSTLNKEMVNLRKIPTPTL